MVPGRMSSYAKKRRLLREHRVQMRIMEDLIEEAGLYTELREEMLVEVGNVPFWLGFDDGPGGMDEASDTEDPETALRHEVADLRREASDRQALVAAVQDLRDHQVMRTDLERARMMLEDARR